MAKAELFLLSWLKERLLSSLRSIFRKRCIIIWWRRRWGSGWPKWTALVYLIRSIRGSLEQYKNTVGIEINACSPDFAANSTTCSTPSSNISHPFLSNTSAKIDSQRCSSKHKNSTNSESVWVSTCSSITMIGFSSYWVDRATLTTSWLKSQKLIGMIWNWWEIAMMWGWSLAALCLLTMREICVMWPILMLWLMWSLTWKRYLVF